MHRQQLDGGHPQVDQVLDHGRVGQAGVRAAQVLGHRRVQPGEALDVQLVDHALRQRRRLGDRLGGRLSGTTTLSGTASNESVGSGM